MFDFFRSRDKGARYLLGALLSLVAISLVITLIPGYGSGGGYAPGSIVAEIGKEVITTDQVRVLVNELTRERRIPPEMAAVYIPQLVDQMIMERAVAYQADRMGIKVSDDDVVAAIQLSMAQTGFFQDGKLVAREQFEAYLAQQGKTINDLMNDMRKQLLLKQLQNLPLESIFVSPQEVEAEAARRTERATIQYFGFNPEKFRSQVTVTPQDLQTYFETNKAVYRIPPKRSFGLVVVDEERVGQTLTVSDEQLRNAYNEQRDRFRTPDRVKVRHILVMTQGKPESEKPKLKAKAEDLLKQVKGGADFAELAKKNSDDTNSAVKGGDLDWVVRGQTVPEFERTAFSLKPKEISGIVETTYGYHILQVTEKQEARVQPFEEVKSQLMAEVRAQLLNEAVQKKADEVRAALVKAPKQAAEIAQKNGLFFANVDKAPPGEPLPVIGTSPEIDSALQNLRPGEVTPVVTLPGNRLAIAVLNEITPGRDAELAEVEARVRERVIDQKSQLLAEQKAKEAGEKLKSNPEQFEAIAKSLGLEISSPPPFGHNEAVEGLGSSAYVEEAFRKPVGSVLGPINVTGRQVIYKVTARTEPDPTRMAAERENIQMDLKQKRAVERRDLFYDSVLTRLIKEGKVKIYRDAIQRLVAGARG
jgi:peptidyl-prolyl cis-trans isomerase D